MKSLIHVVFFLLCLSSFHAITMAQQPYVDSAATNCSISDNPSSILFGYSCNGLNTSCLSYLIFRSQSPFSSVSSISALFSADPSLLSDLNAVSASHRFSPDRQVIVPVPCSCSDDYSQANITYTVEEGDSYSLIASSKLQGLSTCEALQKQNTISATELVPGMKIVVPLRCACPTPAQINERVNYLLTYTVVSGDSVFTVSEKFGVDFDNTLEANQLSLQNSTIFPNTTLLIPLEGPPSISETAVPPAPPPAFPPRENEGKSRKTWIYVLVGVLAGGAVLGVLGVTIFCLFPWKATRKDYSEAMGGETQSFEANKLTILDKQSDTDYEVMHNLSNVVGESLRVYKFQELRSATGDFSPSSSVEGSGYLGRINSDYARIKKIAGDVSEEVKLLSKLNHFNIIRLSGFCVHDSDWYLVYEHASNGRLSEWIHNIERSGRFLSWTQRMQIGFDVATGLNYLHNFTTPPCVHKDLTSKSILLDTDFRAKIAEFQLARSTEGPNGERDAFTRHVVGTQGYLAPEYLEHGFVSTKLDVYAFGVVVLEIVTGQEAAELSNTVGPADELDEEERCMLWEKHIDPCLRGVYPSDLARFVVRLIVKCLKTDHISRPSMDDIAQSFSVVLTSSLSWETASRPH